MLVVRLRAELELLCHNKLVDINYVTEKLGAEVGDPAGRENNLSHSNN